ncbi:MAG: bifunctional riboflavin kinase/FAD synthetase [Anaerolineales bacterium]|nr:bifunctional riboflavin kinase/FAD synthetase [Anaerolineales bacterium]MCB9128805.1 bifunctional riboflavin kinase/FAD synthetase [Ardenticatenales bacterium]MCB9171369.1 bifunctional riboflavin kinase/FAD synthetase [Ardenticatenales bacterium]
MQLLRDDFSPFVGESVLTIGNFDGVHRGHQALINHVHDRAAALGVKSALITFDPHPATVLRPHGPPPLLTTTAQKIDLLEAAELDLLGLLTFNRALMETRAADFMQQLHNALRPREIWIGSDFAMGYKREGDVAFMQAWGEPHGIRVDSLPLLSDGGEIISSSRIRAALAAGAMDEAARLLGRAVTLGGVVVHGAKRGRTIGYPTANVVPPATLALPADGIYAGYTWLADGQRLPSAINVGVRPTFDDDVARNVESYILDWTGDLYDQWITIEFTHYLRPEAKFDSLEALIAQIDADVAETRTLLHVEVMER